MRKVKYPIAFVTSSGREDRWCGAQESHYQIVKQLGPSVLSVTGGPNGISRRLSKEGLPVIEIPFPPENVRNFKESSIIPKIRAVLSAARYSLVLAYVLRRHGVKVIYTVIGPAVILGPFAAKLAGARVVTGVRGTPQKMARWRWVFRLSDLVVVLSNEMKDVLAQALAELPTLNLETRTRVIYNGVDLNDKSAKTGNSTKPRPRLGISRDDVMLLYPAAFRPWKGQHKFIKDVFPLLFKDGCMETKAHLVFIGSASKPEDEEYEWECRKASVDSGLSSYIHFGGFQNNIWLWYACTDIVVLASENLEGMPRVIIEAMSCGKPVVSYDVCSARELLDKSGGGVVIPQDDSKGMARVISDLGVNRSRREEMGARGQEFAMEHLDIRSIAKAYAEMFAEFT